MEKYKLLIFDFIKFYYEELGNIAGGSLHIVLDDGNIEKVNIHWCYEHAKKQNDSFGVFLSLLLMEFTEDELEKMYENDWKSKDRQ